MKSGCLAALFRGCRADLGIQRQSWYGGSKDTSPFAAMFFSGSDRFLEYNIEDPDAAQKIGQFLDRDLPWWGQVNKNTEKVLEDTQ